MNIEEPYVNWIYNTYYYYGIIGTAICSDDKSQDRKIRLYYVHVYKWYLCKYHMLLYIDLICTLHYLLKWTLNNCLGGKRVSYRCEMRFARGSVPRVVQLCAHYYVGTRQPRSAGAAGRRDCGRATACAELTCWWFSERSRDRRIVHRGVLIGRRQRENAFQPITGASAHYLKVPNNWCRLKFKIPTYSMCLSAYTERVCTLYLYQTMYTKYILNSYNYIL